MKRVCLLLTVILIVSFPAFSLETEKIYKSISWEELLLNKEEFLNNKIQIKGYGDAIDKEGFNLIERIKSSNSIFVNMVKIKRDLKEVIINRYNGKMKITVEGMLQYDDINERYQIVADYLMY